MTVPAVDPLLHADLSASDGGTSFSPTQVMEVELTEPLPTVPASGPYRRVLMLARLFTEPVGLPPDPRNRHLARRCESRRKGGPTPVQGGQRVPADALGHGRSERTA
jgi:hypothetical protein